MRPVAGPVDRRSGERNNIRARNVVQVDYDRQAIGVEIERLFVNDDRPRDVIYGTGNAGECIADVLANCELTIEKRLTF